MHFLRCFISLLGVILFTSFCSRPSRLILPDPTVHYASSNESRGLKEIDDKRTPSEEKKISIHDRIVIDGLAEYLKKEGLKAEDIEVTLSVHCESNGLHFSKTSHFPIKDSYSLSEILPQEAKNQKDHLTCDWNYQAKHKPTNRIYDYQIEPLTVQLSPQTEQPAAGISVAQEIRVQKYTIKSFKPLVHFYKNTAEGRERVEVLSSSEEEAVDINKAEFSLLDGLDLFKDEGEADYAKRINLSLNVFAFCKHVNKKNPEGMALSYTERFQTNGKSSYSFANMLSQNLRAILKNAKSAGYTLQCNFIIEGVTPGRENNSIFNYQVDNLLINIDPAGVQEQKLSLPVAVENEITSSDPESPVILTATRENLARTFILDNKEEADDLGMEEATKKLQLMCLNSTFRGNGNYIYFSEEITYPIFKNKITIDEIVYNNQNNSFDSFLETVRKGNEKEQIKSIYCYVIQYKANTIDFLSVPFLLFLSEHRVSISAQFLLDNEVYVDNEKSISEIQESLKNAELMSYTIRNNENREVEVDVRMRPHGENLREIFVNEQYQYPDMLYNSLHYTSLYEVRTFEVIDGEKGLLKYDPYALLEKSKFFLSPNTGIQIRQRIISFGDTKLCSEQVFDGDANKLSFAGFVLESSSKNYIKIDNSVEGKARGFNLNEYNSYHLRLGDQVASRGDVFQGRNLHSKAYFSSSFQSFFQKVKANNNEEGHIPFSATMLIECDTPSIMYGKTFDYKK